MIANTKQQLKTNIRSKRKSFYAGVCYSVTSLNEKGEFDILPQHANFISLVRNYITVNKGAEGQKKFAVSEGILVAKENVVDVFLN